MGYILKTEKTNNLPRKELDNLAKGKVVIKAERCKACELCVSVCPKNILKIDEVEINKQGYHPVCIVSEEECIACGSCGLMCPDGVINVYKVD